MPISISLKGYFSGAKRRHPHNDENRKVLSASNKNGHLLVRYFFQHSAQRHFMTFCPVASTLRESLQPCRALISV